MSRRLAVLALAVVVGAEARAQGIATVDIPYQKFVLDNGLTLIVHEDHKAPIVAVNVWYHVGSKNERPGKTGFAHLFEHLMFNGSEHFNDDYFKVLERLGATDLNGTTNNDRTNYFQNVPVSALDTVLWMESDRMGHLLGRHRPAAPRRAARRRAEREAPGREPALRPGVQPHPGEHLPEGTSVLLDRHRLDGGPERRLARRREGVVQDLLRRRQRHAGRSPATSKPDERQEEGRDSTSATSPRARPSPATTRGSRKRTGVHRQQMQDRVPQARIYKVWNTPQIGVGRRRRASTSWPRVLASGKTSRLYKRLVYDDQIATDVNAFQ